AGSFAHVPAHKYKTKEGLINRNSLYGMSVTEDAARKLNSIVIKNFLSLGIPAFSFSPASFLISDGLRCSKSYIDSIKTALHIGVIPVVYGDVIIDKKIGCTIFSTEKILSILARELMGEYKIRIVYATDTDGVYNKKVETIERITPANFGQVKKAIIGAGGADVTGGMLHKVEEALRLAKNIGIETLVVNGMKAGSLRNAIVGAKVEGTRIG
ncbi:MAG: isopentenyl phosphate kinase, partial [Candidatus Woesebacteria bacterium]|nr:isopentenyl phosphate kinase [Candidatus Woesebacteria bacterium]